LRRFLVSSPWCNSRGRRLCLLNGIFVFGIRRIRLQYASFLILDPVQNPRRDTAREFHHGLLGVSLLTIRQNTLREDKRRFQSNAA